MSTDDGLARVRMRDGTVVGLRVARGDGFSEISDRSLDFEVVANAIRSVSSSLVDALDKARPTKATVELGFEFQLQGGVLLTILARGQTTATITVTLEWERKE